MDDAFDDHADAPRYPHRERDAAWVEQARSGSDQAFGHLYDAWFDRVFDLTSRIVRNRDAALEVTQDAFLSAWRNLDSLADPGAFGGWLLRIARNGSLNRQQKELRSLPMDDQDFAVMEAVGGSASNAPTGFTFEDRLASETDPERALENAEARELVWQAAAALGERDTEVLNLQLRHGLSPAEVGEVLGLNRNAANQLVHRVRGRFEVALRARLLWRNNKPACKELRRLLASAGVDGFSVEAVKIADKHAPSCAECSDRRKSALAPAAMFGAIPVMAAPIAFKQQAAYALENAGVPMAGSSYGSAATGLDAVPDGDGPSDGSGDGGGQAGQSGRSGHSGSGGAASGVTRHIGRKALVMAGVGVAVVLLVITTVAGRLSDPARNEVVALASGSPGSNPNAVPGHSATSIDESSSTATSTLDATETASTDTTSTSPTSGVVSPPTSTGTKTTIVGPTITTPDGSIVPAPNPGPGPAPGPSPGPTVTSPPKVFAFLSMVNDSVKRGYPIDPPAAPGPPGPTPYVKWDVTGTGIAGVKISGVGWESIATSGTEAVCPGGPVRGGGCYAPPGVYTYTLQVYGANFALLYEDKKTLTVS